MSFQKDSNLEQILRKIDTEVSKSKQLQERADKILKPFKSSEKTDPATIAAKDPELGQLLQAFEENMQKTLQPAQEMLSQFQLPSKEYPQSSVQKNQQRLKIRI